MKTSDEYINKSTLNNSLPQCNKSHIFSAIIVLEMIIINMQNKFEQELLKLSVQKRKLNANVNTDNNKPQLQ